MDSYIETITPTTYYLGVCTPCARPVREQHDHEGSAEGSAEAGRYASVTCDECGGKVRAERLVAVRSVDVCDSACMAAVGPSCSCSCGGDNHGRTWQNLRRHTTLQTETALAKYRAAVAERKAAAEQARRETAQRRRDAFDAWATDEANADVVRALADAAEFDMWAEWPNDFLCQLARRIERHEELTDRQIQAARRVLTGRARIAERRAAEAAEPTRPVPTGKAITVEGVVIKIRHDQDRYSYHDRTITKMLIKGDGWRVWSTLPNSLQPNVITGVDNTAAQLQGKRVRFTADVTASDDDESFGFAKRPRRAQLLDIEELAAELDSAGELPTTS